MSENDNIQIKLKALRDAYGSQLPVKIKEIKDYREKILVKDDKWQENIVYFHRLLHGLAGSGATFGYEELGKQARQIEILLKPWLNKSEKPSQDEHDNIKNLLEILYSCVSEPVEMLTKDSETEYSVEKKPVNITPSVYLMDEDIGLADELSSQIKAYGYKVNTYYSCTDLISEVKKNAPSVIITDTIYSGGKNIGIKSMHDYRENNSCDIPVIYISTNESFKVRLDAVRAGGEAYITKPVNIDNLILQIDNLTKQELPDPYRILIVDDDPELAFYYKYILNKEGMDVTVLTQPEKIFELMANFNPELILMDIYMPDCSGLDLAKLIRQQDAYIGVPIVYLSTESDHGKQVTALNSGGNDFLTKPISDSNLITSVDVRVKRARELSDLMSQDSLTGLLKHTKIKEELENELSRAKRKNSKFVFAMIDIDHFKKVNDDYGHMSGDHVIKTLSRLLQKRLRKSDSIGRYGGEEFAVILHDASIEDALSVINEIREKFSKINFYHQGNEYHVTLSAGLSGYPMRDQAVLINQAADEALYLAKENGRNCVMLDKK